MPERSLGLLAGVPVAVKDVFCTKDRDDHLRFADAGKTFDRRTMRTYPRAVGRG